MPYRVLVCKLCDTLVQSASAHGNEDEHCEGDDGYEFINLWTDREVADGRAARAVVPPPEPPRACPTCGSGWTYHHACPDRGSGIDGGTATRRAAR